MLMLQDAKLTLNVGLGKLAVATPDPRENLF